MAHFEVYNSLGELIIGEGLRNIGRIGSEEAVGKGGWYSNNILQPPAFIDKSLRIPIFEKIGDMPMGLFKYAEGGCSCGSEYFSANAGVMHWLQENYPKTSGYLDLYNAEGELIWSAISAGSVPRVTQIINLTADEVLNGANVYIGDQYVMLNNFPSVMSPGPMGAFTAGGMYTKFTNGHLDVQFKLRTNTASTTVSYVENAYRKYGFNIYLYTFGA